jgi:undecaprenyl diphosphate synthase
MFSFRLYKFFAAFFVLTSVVLTLIGLIYYGRKYLKSGFVEYLPTKVRHLGIIMDGNRRWGKKNNFNLARAYKAGAEKLFEVLDFCLNSDVKYLSAYALSLDNVKKRTKEELDLIFDTAFKFLEEKANEVSGRLTVNVVGDLSVVPEYLAKKIRKICDENQNGKDLTVNILFAYDPIEDINFASKEHKKESLIKNIRSSDIPPVDLVIRTGDRKRLSGFLPLQIVYSEIYFEKCMWPDLSISRLKEILNDFSKAERSFGR